MSSLIHFTTKKGRGKRLSFGVQSSEFKKGEAEKDLIADSWWKKTNSQETSYH
jgi:hypothetical protein